MDVGGHPGEALRGRTGVPLMAPEAGNPPVGAASNLVAAPAALVAPLGTSERARPAHLPLVDALRARELLATAPLERVYGRTIGNSDAKHGVQQLYRVADVGANRSHLTIVKSLEQGGAQELFAHDVAVALGIDDLLPNMAWREGEGAAIELFEGGRTAADYRYSSGSQLDEAFVRMVRARNPLLAEAAVLHRAAVERQLVHVFDAIVANGDRHPQNILVNQATSELRLIDHGLINRYAVAADGLTPTLRAAYALGDPSAGSGARELQLLPEVQEHLARVDHDAIRTAFDRMMSRIDGSVRIGQESRPMTSQFLDEVLGRLVSYAKTGLVRTRLM